ncbi:MAG: cytidine deaminase [Armatimonadetes bacterium]|nr:cytidine deaminase [Armatimonadota bacterium]
MSPESVAELVKAARAASEYAYAPYSHFRVGAAVRDEHGRVHIGCNVENASYGLTICAERNAVAAMVAAGGTRIVEMALYTPTEKPVTPCGACRQVIAEFGRGATIVLACAGGEPVFSKTEELLPLAFVLD